MSDNEFIQDDHKPKNSIAGTSTSDDQATQIDGKKSGYLARFSQLFDRKKSPSQNTDKSIKPVEEGDKKILTNRSDHRWGHHRLCIDFGIDFGLCLWWT